jgi:hypothetical protein
MVPSSGGGMNNGGGSEVDGPHSLAHATRVSPTTVSPQLVSGFGFLLE